MRPALLLPLAAIVVVGCRPLDAGAPIADAPSVALADADAPGLDLPGGFRIIDGDTFEWQGETVRISNIDAPEKPPRSRCWAEARLARAAASELDRLREESPDLGRFRITREGQDRYGRTLARVTFDGTTDAGEALIERGFAAPWTGRRWDWCAPVTADPNGANIVTAPPSALDRMIEANGPAFDPARPYAATPAK